MFVDAITIISVMIIIASYLLGSVSAAIIVCRMMGLEDPRTVGSNNPGATNVLRHGGKKAAAITLFGDMLKGLLAVLLARLLDQGEVVIALAGFAAFIGHLYPVFFRFEGGKGVATYFGAMLGIHWMTGLAALMCWLLIAKVFKISSLAALITSVAVPVMLYLQGSRTEVVITCAVMSVMLIWRHRSNISKLLAGTEGAISAADSGESEKGSGDSGK